MKYHRRQVDLVVSELIGSIATQACSLSASLGAFARRASSPSSATLASDS